tara:strand:- start:964 stop:1137 length:174 start_codon:yes stop_codon:yes gene_type:complete
MKHTQKSVTSLADARKAKKAADYKKLVISKFDDMQHQDDRAASEHRARIEKAGKERL